MGLVCHFEISKADRCMVVGVHTPFLEIAPCGSQLGEWVPHHGQPEGRVTAVLGGSCGGSRSGVYGTVEKC